jgi:hypothetical protein
MRYDRCRVCYQLVDAVESEDDTCAHCRFVGEPEQQDQENELTPAEQVVFEGTSEYDY